MANGHRYNKMNELKSFIKHTCLSGSKMNMFQYCMQNTRAHEDLKFRVFCDLIDAWNDVYTEVEFKDGKGRADIVVFDKEGNGTIIEIQGTEKDSSIERKKDKYPIQFEFFVIKVGGKYELPL